MDIISEESYRIMQHNHLFRLINIVREGTEMSLLSQAEYLEEIERFSKIRPKAGPPTKEPKPLSE